MAGQSVALDKEEQRTRAIIDELVAEAAATPGRPMTETQDRRDFSRWAIGERGTLQVGDETHGCRVANVSPSGMLVETEAQLMPRTVVTVALSGLLPFRARAVRSDTDGTGLRFVDVPQCVFR